MSYNLGNIDIPDEFIDYAATFRNKIIHLYDKD